MSSAADRLDRAADGFWTRFPPEQFATWSGLSRTAVQQPVRLAEFILCLLAPIASAKPNPAHVAIEPIEHHTRVTVITQNVDCLHQEAGSNTVYGVHGSSFEIVTLKGDSLECCRARRCRRSSFRCGESTTPDWRL